MAGEKSNPTLLSEIELSKHSSGSSELDGLVKIKVDAQRLWVQAVDGENAGHISFFVAHSTVLLRKLGRRFTRGIALIQAICCSWASLRLETIEVS
jgi:hypothetical protein